MCGASTTSRLPRSWAPANATLLHSFPGSLTGSGLEVSSAMTTYRSPLPSADTAAMLPCTSGGMSGPDANFAQFAGSKGSPAGSLRADSSLGSTARSEMSMTLNSGPKLDFTPTTLPMSALVAAVSVLDEQPASTHTAAIAHTSLDIVANL